MAKVSQYRFKLPTEFYRSDYAGPTFPICLANDGNPSTVSANHFNSFSTVVQVSKEIYSMWKFNIRKFKYRVYSNDSRNPKPTETITEYLQGVLIYNANSFEYDNENWNNYPHPPLTKKSDFYYNNSRHPLPLAYDIDGWQSLGNELISSGYIRLFGDSSTNGYPSLNSSESNYGLHAGWFTPTNAQGVNGSVWVSRFPTQGLGKFVLFQDNFYFVSNSIPEETSNTTIDLDVGLYSVRLETVFTSDDEDPYTITNILEYWPTSIFYSL